jgi:hypothetical protein
MHKVTVYSNWVKTSEHEFETQEEAREFAEEMKNQQYVTIIDEEEVEEDDPMDDYNYVGSPDHY